MGRECPCGSGKRKRWGNKETGRVCCVDCKKDDMIDLDAPKKCGCPKNAAKSFGFPDGKAVCCSSCKEDGMINLNSQRCGCSKNAVPSFGYPDGRKTCCASCIKEGMINLKKAKCGCEKAVVPIFGFPEDERATCCVTCKKEGMMNIVDRKCRCGISVPCFAGSGETTPVCCSQCKDEGMVDVKNRLCACGSARPSYGLVETKKATACVRCKGPDMVQLTNHNCPCGKIACFAFPEEAVGKFCSRCKEPGMVDVLNKKCSCGSARPSFGYPTDQIVRCCTHCKNNEMISLTKGPECKSEFCSTGVPNKKYEGYCLRCFIYLFPDKPTAQNVKIKENHVTDFIKKIQKGASLKETDVRYDKRVAGPCASGKRPDVWIDRLTHVMVIEIDENSHANYDCSCENKRMMEIFEDSGSRPIVFIRFNPDGYVNADNQKQESCFKYNPNTGTPHVRDNKTWQKRLDILLERMIFHCKHIPNQEVTIEHLFYNGFV